MAMLTTVGRVRPGDHCCLAFQNEDDRKEVLATFVGEGLAAGQKVLYFTDAARTETANRRLARSGPPVSRFVKGGQLVLATTRAAFLGGGRFDPDSMVAGLQREAATAVAQGYRGLRLATEMAWALRGVPGTHRLLEYEAKVQRVFDSGMVMGICQYDLRLFTEEELLDIEDLHPASVGPDPIYADGLLRISRELHPARLRLTGDVDASNVDAVARSLTTALTGRGDVHIDLSGVVFCDVDGIRAIVSTARALNAGRRLVLHGLPAHLQRVMRLVGWDELPSLVLAA